MDRHRSVRGYLLLCLGLVGSAVLAVVGCTASGLTRAVSREEVERPAYDVATIGDKTIVGNAQPVRLGGVGLVEGLDGTGGDCRHDEYRAMLIDDLKRAKVTDIKKRLASNTCAMVIVEAQLVPGAGKGQLLDVQVKLPPGSRASSIRGGYLRRCTLYNYDFAKNLRPEYTGGRGLLRGHPAAFAEGPVLMMTGPAGDSSTPAVMGRIWSGARVLKEYPLALVMNAQSQQGVLTGYLADRINDLFLPGAQPSQDSQIAHTNNSTLVSLRVPPQYRHNLPRFLRVVRFIPLEVNGGRPHKDAKDQRTYRQKLGDDLLDPNNVLEVALRLEALGPQSAELLQRGLKSKNALVRFASAEALAYLGSPSCAEELGLAARSSLFRAYALTALASLPEAVCTAELHQLMESNLTDETRYGAFRALVALNPRAEDVRGVRLADSFTMHHVAPGMRPLIHLTTTKRAEVVLFGDAPRLQPPFRLLAGDFTLTAAAGDLGCTVSRFPRHGADARRQCGLELEEIIRLMADLGGQYSDVVALMQAAHVGGYLSAQAKFDALPRAADLEELAEAGLGKGKQELGEVPTLLAGN
jgi:hypothetical protein